MSLQNILKEEDYLGNLMGKPMNAEHGKGHIEFSKTLNHVKAEYNQTVGDAGSNIEKSYQHIKVEGYPIEMEEDLLIKTEMDDCHRRDDAEQFSDIKEPHISNEALSTHISTHREEKIHSCSTCYKSFSKRSNLLMHIRTHTGEKPYSCNQCSKGFYHSSDLLKHM